VPRQIVPAACAALDAGQRGGNERFVRGTLTVRCEAALEDASGDGRGSGLRTRVAAERFGADYGLGSSMTTL
jgi:hypothetical protein